MSLTLSARERDLLYEQVLDRMSGIGDLWFAIHAGDFENADRIGREFVEDFTLISEDLGWGAGNDDAVELTTSPQILRRALRRHCELAITRDAAEVLDRQELTLAKEHNELIVRACRQLLTDLDTIEGPEATPQ